MAIDLRVLFVGTVLACCAPAVVRYAEQPARLATLIGLALALSVWGTIGYVHAERTARPAPFAAVHTILALTTIYAARTYGPVGILLIPVAAQIGLLFERRAALGIAAILSAASQVPEVALGADLGAGLVMSMFMSGTGVFFGVLFAQLVRSTLRARDEIERLNGDLAGANRRLTESARTTAALAIAEERNRIAREIHDSVGHALTTARIQLDAASRMLPHEPSRAHDLVAKAHGVVGEGLDDVRRAVATMRTDAPIADLETALTDLVERARQTGLQVAAKHIGSSPRALSPAVTHTVFRTAQEALTNVRKHGVGTASLEFTQDGHRIHLVVRNACPIEQAPPPAASPKTRVARSASPATAPPAAENPAAIGPAPSSGFGLLGYANAPSSWTGRCARNASVGSSCSPSRSR